MFKSSDKKKRNLIRNYFSLIKRDLRYDNDPINSTGRKLFFFKRNNFPELSFRKNKQKTINKDIFNKINNSQITNAKKKVTFMPILNPIIKGKEYSKTKV